MTSFIVFLTQNVEVKWVCVVVDCFVFDKEFGHQTQILTVQNLLVSIYLKHLQVPVCIDFIAWIIPRTKGYLGDGSSCS